MADDLMQELAPLLAEDGIDFNDSNSLPDMETLQRALNSAVERHNLQLVAPVGEGRALALTTLRLFVRPAPTTRPSWPKPSSPRLFPSGQSS